MSGAFADVHHVKSELLIATCGKLNNDDVRWALSGVLFVYVGCRGLSSTLLW